MKPGCRKVSGLFVNRDRSAFKVSIFFLRILRSGRILGNFLAIMGIIPTTPAQYSPSGRVLSWMITILLWSALFTPLVISSSTLFPFQTGKGILFRVLIEISAFLYVWLIVLEPRARPKRDELFWSVIAFGCALGFSAFLGVDPYRSFWGDLERMEGVFGILHGIALFVIASGLFQRREDWVRFFSVSLAASFFVALYAFAQVDPAFRFFPVFEAREIQPGSTFGHQSFLATYAIFQIFFGLFIVLLQKSPVWRAFGVCGSVINLILLTLTAVRGAQVGILVAGAVGIFLTAVYVVKNLKTRIALGGTLLVVMVLFGVILSLKDSPHLKKFPYALQRMATISPDAAMARTRLIALRVSWEAFKERPVLGWGQENFKIPYNRYFDPEHLYHEGAWFDRAHNKIAEVAVQTGLVGSIGYVSMFFFGFLGLMRFIRTRDSSAERLLPVSVIMLGSAYVVQNLFLFDTPTSYLMFFSSLAFVPFLLNEDKRIAGLKGWKKSQVSGRTMVKSPRSMFLVVGGILTVFLIVYANWIPYTTAQLGRTGVDVNNPQRAIAIFEQIRESGGFPTTEATTAMMEALINSGKSKQEEWANVVRRLEQHFSPLVSCESADPRILIRLGKLYNDRGLTDSTYLDKAERVLQKAIAFAPARPEGYQELGVTYLQRGEEERGMRLFHEALALNELNARARWVLGLALASQRRFEEGMTHLEGAMSGGYNWDNPADIGNLSFIYSSMNLTDRLVELYELSVERHPENAGYRMTLARVRSMRGKTTDGNVN